MLAGTSYDYQRIASRMRTVTVPWVPKAATLLCLYGLRTVGGRATIELPPHALLSGPRAFGRIIRASATRFPLRSQGLRRDTGTGTISPVAHALMSVNDGHCAPHSTIA